MPGNDVLMGSLSISVADVEVNREGGRVGGSHRIQILSPKYSPIPSWVSESLGLTTGMMCAPVLDCACPHEFTFRMAKQIARHVVKDQYLGQILAFTCLSVPIAACAFLFSGAWERDTLLRIYILFI